MSALIDKYAPRAEALKEAQLEALDASTRKTPLSKEQAIYSTALALLPIIAGMAIRGRRGAASGAKAAAFGTAGYFKNLESDEEAQQRAELARAKMLAQESGRLESGMMRMEQKGAEL